MRAYVKAAAFAALLLCAPGAEAQLASLAPTPSPSPAAPAAEAKTAAARTSEAKAGDAKKSDAKAAETKTPAAKAGAVPVLPPEKAQPVRLPRFEAPPAIDGKLDEEVWKQAAVLKDFYQIQPGDNIEPSAGTEVYIGFDAKYLYVAFKALDDPSKVRATVARRDNVFGEDNVRLILDTFNDQRRAYVIGFNPLGVQQDGIMTEGMGTDYSVDLVMESKGALTADGYVVEAAIPFKSLRYAAGKDKLWGIHVWRNIDRNNDELDSWMPMARDASGTLNQAGKITGLEGISTERTVEFIPSFTVSETGRRARTMSRAQARALGVAEQGRFVNQPVEVDPGLTAKFVVSGNMTLDLAVNPDFAQVEADATVNTANQRFPIFFEEKRPFFLEGIEIFRTQIAAVHTRTIIDPDVAAKLTGKQGRNTYGILLASDNAPGDFTNEQRFDPERLPAAGDRIIGKNATVGIFRLKRDVGKENHIGFLATTYNFADRSNYVGGFDTRIRFDKQTTLNLQALGTNARRCTLARLEEDDRCRTRNGFVYAYSFDKAGRHLWWNVNGVGRTAGYVADLGFTRRTNSNSHNFNIGYNTEAKPKARIVSWNAYSYLGAQHDWQGRMQNWTYEGQVGPNFQRQTYIRAGYNTGYERVFAYEFGLPAFAGGRGERSAGSKNVFAYFGTTPHKKINFNYFLAYRWGQLDYDFGNGRRFPRVSRAALEDPSAPLDPGPGGFLYTNGGVTLKPTDALNVSLSFSKNRLTRGDTGLVAFDSNIYSARTTYQFTRFMFARARLDYSSINSNLRGQFLFGWTPNPGTAFYAGYNDDLNRNYFNPFSGHPEPGFRRNGRTFFIKASYLFRRSF